MGIQATAAAAAEVMLGITMARMEAAMAATMALAAGHPMATDTEAGVTPLPSLTHGTIQW